MPFDAAPETEIELPNQKAIAVLRRMERLLMKGWIKGDFETDEGVCMLGALNKATFRPPAIAEPKLGPLGREVEQHLTRMLPLSFGDDIAAFNDYVTTTKKGVLAVVRRTIKSLE